MTQQIGLNILEMEGYTTDTVFEWRSSALKYVH